MFLRGILLSLFYQITWWTLTGCYQVSYFHSACIFYQLVLIYKYSFGITCQFCLILFFKNILCVCSMCRKHTTFVIIFIYIFYMHVESYWLNFSVILFLLQAICIGWKIKFFWVCFFEMGVLFEWLNVALWVHRWVSGTYPMF